MFYTWRWLPPILGVLQGIGASLIAGTCDWAEAGRGVTVSRCHNADIFGSMLRLWSKFSSNHLDTAAQEGCFTKWFRLRLELSCGTFQHFHCGLNLKTFASPSLGLQSAWNWESRHLHLVGSASLSQSWGFVGFWLLRSCPKAEHVHIRCQEFFFLKGMQACTSVSKWANHSSECIVSSWLRYFLIYCVWKGNKPQVNPQIIGPGFISGACTRGLRFATSTPIRWRDCEPSWNVASFESWTPSAVSPGVMWAVAQSCWFVANVTCLQWQLTVAILVEELLYCEVQLGYSAAFPIILIGPGLIGSLWSVFLFKAGHWTRQRFSLVQHSLTRHCLCVWNWLAQDIRGQRSLFMHLTVLCFVLVLNTLSSNLLSRFRSFLNRTAIGSLSG